MSIYWNANIDTKWHLKVFFNREIQNLHIIMHLYSCKAKLFYNCEIEKANRNIINEDKENKTYSTSWRNWFLKAARGKQPWFKYTLQGSNLIELELAVHESIRSHKVWSALYLCQFIIQPRLDLKSRPVATG